MPVELPDLPSAQQLHKVSLHCKKCDSRGIIVFVAINETYLVLQGVCPGCAGVSRAVYAIGDLIAIVAGDRSHFSKTIINKSKGIVVVTKAEKEMNRWDSFTVSELAALDELLGSFGPLRPNNLDLMRLGREVRAAVIQRRPPGEATEEEDAEEPDI